VKCKVRRVDTKQITHGHAEDLISANANMWGKIVVSLRHIRTDTAVWQ
jgi:hypothetical protein